MQDSARPARDTHPPESALQVSAESSAFALLQHAPIAAALCEGQRIVESNEAFRKLSKFKQDSADAVRQWFKKIRAPQVAEALLDVASKRETVVLTCDAYIKGRKKSWKVFSEPYVLGGREYQLVWLTDNSSGAERAAYWELHTQMNSAVAQIKVEKREREQQAEAAKLARREAEAAHENIRLILDSAAQGFVTIDLEGRVVGEWSRAADAWFEGLAIGASFCDILAKLDETTGQWLDAGLSELREGSLCEELLLEQLPSRIHRHEQLLEIEYRPIRDAGEISRLVLVVSDVTAQEVARRLESQQRETVEAFRGAMRDRHGFAEFVQETDRLVESLGRQDASRTNQLRWLHTVKGNTALMGFRSIADLCHEIETATLESGGGVAAQDARLLQEAWLEFKRRAVLPFLDDRGAIRLDRDSYQAFLRKLEGSTPRSELALEVKQWSWQTVEARFRRLGDRARAMALRMGRGELQISLDANGLRVDDERLAPFWSSLVHVIRNAISHGFQPLLERERSGLPAPVLELRAQAADGKLVIEVADNGCGIDWGRLRARAAQHGLPSETRAELQAALFAPGLTTTEAVSDVSGRGMGMSAVQESVLALRGAIEVHSEPGAGTRFVFRIPL